MRRLTCSLFTLLLLPSPAALAQPVIEPSRATRAEDASSEDTTRDEAKPRRDALEKRRAQTRLGTRLFRESKLALFDGRYQVAIDRCTLALEEGVTDCYRVIGMAHKHRGEVALACENFTLALELKPKNEEALREQLELLSCS